MADKKRKITLEDLIRSFTPSIPPKATTREQRATLLSTNYSTLREAASHPSLMVGDTESILSVTVKRLDQYDGPNDSDAFCEWALSEVVQPGVQRFIDFYKMKSEHSGAVRAGIWRILKGCTDLGFDNSTFAGIEANAWFTIFVGLDGFLVPGTAKLSTRLYEEGRYAGLTWRTLVSTVRRRRDEVRFIRRHSDMPVKTDTLLSLWDMENMPACDEGMELARRFLEAAGECVNTLGHGRTSSSRADLLWTYNAMVIHSDRCDKCNEV